MIGIHKSSERGSANYGWLDTKYSFSFANYHNPQKMGFGKLRVLNDDIVAPGKGFGMHSHDNMEIVTLVLEGTLEHKDSMGNHGIIKAGEVQRISAGTGIKHSEFNHSREKPVHLLQIWVEPKELDIAPSYEQKSFDAIKKNTLFPLVLGKKARNALYMHQDGGFYLARVDEGTALEHTPANGNGAYVFIISGVIALGKHILSSGDAASITGQTATIASKQPSEVLLIEVPMQ